ncbi:unnamed protein product [Umbelopsis ramanniana]
MGKVTYAIGFKNELPLQNEIKQQKRLYAQYQRTNNELLVAETATQIADTLLDQWEELIATGEAVEEEQKSLETALKYCDEARYIFKRFENWKNVVSVDLLRIKCMQSAIAVCHRLESRVLIHITDNESVRQEFYKSYADLYFNKGADESESKFDDFENAKRYYEIEQRILQHLKEANHANRGNLQDLIRANTFNLGVIESKIRGDLSMAETLLRKAIEVARLLSDLQSERSAWWELANLKKLQNNFQTALECHLNELRLAQLDELQETELLCLYDIAVTHLEMNSLEKCKEIESDIMELANDQSYAESLIQPLKAVRDNEAIASDFEKSQSTDSVRNAQIYLSLAKAYVQVSMNKKALQTLEKCFRTIEGGVDAASIALKLDHLVLKGDVKWQMKIGDVSELTASYLKALSLIDSASEHLSTMHVFEAKMACIQTLTRIYDYFHVTQESDRWSLELNHLESSSHIPERSHEDYLPSSEEELDEEAPIPSQKLESQLSPAQDESVTHMEIVNSTSFSTVIEVHVTNTSQDWRLLVPWTDKSSTVKWLSNEVASRYWIAFAKWPRFSHLEAGGAVIFANDTLAHVLPDSKPTVMATIERYEPKCMEDIYMNVCARHEYPPDGDIRLQLGSSDSNNVSLTGLGIMPDFFKPLALTIGLSESICILDLSANLLDDSAISTLFAATVNGSHPIMPNLKGINLASNLITTTGFALLVNSLSQSLESLNISYNPLGGADAILIMSKAISRFPSLASINLENCNIGDIADDGIQSTEPDVDNLSKRCCGISVNIANNPTSRRTEEILEAELTRVPDLFSLNYSRMISLGSSALLAFISSLNSLQRLDVSNTTLADDGVGSICNLIKRTSNLKFIDMNHCGMNSGRKLAE